MFNDPQHHQRFEKYICTTEIVKNTIRSVEACFFHLLFVITSIPFSKTNVESEPAWLGMLRHQAAENSRTFGASKKVLFSSSDNCSC